MRWTAKKNPRHHLRQADFARTRVHANPFKPETEPSHKNIWLGIIAGVSVLAASGLALFHPAFQVDIVTIDGATRTDYREVQKTVQQILQTKLWWVFPRQNYFFVDQKGIEEVLTNRFRLETVSSHKTFPHTLTITITERGPKVIMITDQIMTAVSIDAEEVAKLGRVQTPYNRRNLSPLVNEAKYIAKSSPAGFTDLPLVVLNSVAMVRETTPEVLPVVTASTTVSSTLPTASIVESTTTTRLSPDMIDGILQWHKFLQEKEKPANYFVVNEGTVGEAVLTNGSKLLINFVIERDSQFLAADTFWKQKNTSSTLEYLDLRYPGKVFWK